MISYAIANLEQQLGLPLFDRETTRRAQLTEAGAAVLAEARTVSHSLDALRAKVGSMLSGLEAEISIAVSVLMPGDRLVDVLTGFQARFSTVALRLECRGVGRSPTIRHQRTIGHRDRGRGLGRYGPAIEQISVGDVEMLPVAAPEHPLVTADAETPGSARDHVQLVIADRTPLSEGQEFGIVATRTWRLSDLSSKRTLLLAGIGWGTMPTHLVQADIDAGRLVELHMPEATHRRLPFTAIYRADKPPGPAGCWLIQRFVEQSSVGTGTGSSASI
ncbi:LysR family transcriptional regulator [Methylobacterium gnaphalii]|uniref:LysR family transcriptional regulator n=1 Tax=Methylobacterium gnaphalii TaxID=1010610 RepID=A0A512JPZ1_9HYPH|nr:LysR family transcriptional regulator [Methylobacterium gnaphalii]GLS51241.1 LysR family transcriptional regulator [Methylobacterium gnaphalii]